MIKQNRCFFFQNYNKIKYDKYEKFSQSIRKKRKTYEFFIEIHFHFIIQLQVLCYD
jgi:hypothetical protein